VNRLVRRSCALMTSLRTGESSLDYPNFRGVSERNTDARRMGRLRAVVRVLSYRRPPLRSSCSSCSCRTAGSLLSLARQRVVRRVGIVCAGESFPAPPEEPQQGPLKPLFD
jgi:hypothetical protein